MRYILSIAVLICPTIGLACSCAWPASISERLVLDRLCAADAVFVGDVESELSVRDNIFEYKIWPRESFKGRLESPSYLVSDVGSMCGYPFRAHGRYLIFANNRKETNYLSASICDLTRLMDRDDDVYKILTANKDSIGAVCGDEAIKARRLERLREQDKEREELEKDTRE